MQVFNGIFFTYIIHTLGPPPHDKILILATRNMLKKPHQNYKKLFLDQQPLVTKTNPLSQQLNLKENQTKNTPDRSNNPRESY